MENGPHVALLSPALVFQRERPLFDGGDLREGRVVVCDLQPMPRADLAIQVRRNLDNGIRYFYFLYMDMDHDTIEQICQALQLILTARHAEAGKAPNFDTRLGVVRDEPDRVLKDLEWICRTRSLQISFLPEAPQFCFRVHNADDPELARLYLRYGQQGFLVWAEGARAVSAWSTLPAHAAAPDREPLFIPTKQFELTDDAKHRFEAYLDKGLHKYFPGLREQVKRLCLGRAAGSTAPPARTSSE